MEEIRLKARAKINLTLDVTGKRDNGYHELQMIMQTVGLYDEIVLRKIPENEIRLESNVSWLPADNRNLAWRAAELMRSTYDIKEGVLIQIDKRIPVAAGLAGGSADCAAAVFAEIAREKAGRAGFDHGNRYPLLCAPGNGAGRRRG
mgnify:CR=1 FL=1